MHHIVIIPISIFVLFRNATCYTNSLLMRIHVNIAKVFNIYHMQLGCHMHDIREVRV